MSNMEIYMFCTLYTVGPSYPPENKEQNWNVCSTTATFSHIVNFGESALKMEYLLWWLVNVAALVALTHTHIPPTYACIRHTCIQVF